MVRLSIHLMAGLALAAVILHTPKLSLHQIPLSKGYVLYLVSTLLGVFGLIILLGPLPLYFVLIPLGAAVALGLRNVRFLPAAYTFVPLNPEEGSTVTADDEEPTRPLRGIAYGLFLQRVVWRNLYGRWLLWIWLAIFCFIFLGVLLSGVTWTDQDLYYQRFILIPITIYVLLALIAMPMRNLYRFDPLPISRRLLFAVITLPFLAILCVGYGAGQIGNAWGEPKELIRYRMDPDSHYYLYVPIRALQIAWDGKVPDITSPWGETHAAWSEPLYRGRRTLFYSPYHTPKGSSLDFVAYQISRSAEAIYGESVPPQEIKERYLELDAEGNVVLKGQALTLQADYPQLSPRPKGAIFPIVLLLVGAPWFIVVSIYLRAFRSEVSERMRKFVFFGLLAVLMAVHLSQYVLFLSRLTQDWKITAVVEYLIRQGSESLGSAAIWAASLVLLYAGYRFAENRFLQIEVPDKPDKLPVWEALAES
jgi:hypothetical protein